MVFGISLTNIPIDKTKLKNVAGGLKAAYRLATGSYDIAKTAMDSEDEPFEEIKKKFDMEFNEMERKLNHNTVYLEKITEMITNTLSVIGETRGEIRERFDNVLISIENSKIEPIISKINNFIHYFEIESKRIRGLELDEYMAELKDPRGILLYLKNSRTSRKFGLYAPLFTIIDQDYAIPDDVNDGIAFKALYALMYGTQTYFSVFLFLIEQYVFIASYHYEREEIDDYRTSFNDISNIFSDFKSSLLKSRTSKGNFGIIDAVIDVLNTVKNKDFISLYRDDLFQMLTIKIESLENMKNNIESMELPLITNSPSNYESISLDKNIKTNIWNWIKGNYVQYAVQYKSENKSIFPKVSEWSDAVIIKENACPILTFPSDRSGKTVFILRKFGNIEKPHLVGSLEPSQTSFFDIDRDLFNAVKNPDREAGYHDLQILLSNGANLSAVFEGGRRVLHAAAESGNARVISEYFVNDTSMNLNLVDEKGYTPLHIAAQAGNVEVVKILLDNNASVNAVTNLGLTPLHIAAQQGFITTIQRLFENPDVNLNSKDNDGFTPLHYAITGGGEVTEILIKNDKVNINVKSNNGLTPFHLAVVNDDLDVAEILMKSNIVDVNSEDSAKMTPLHYAAMLGHTKFITYLKSFLSKNITDMIDINSYSPLHYAIMFKNDDAALELLNVCGDNKNLKATSKSSPLHFAVTFERKKIISELVEEKWLIDETTDDGYTALHLAAMRKDPEIISILITGGANIEARTNDGLTPLQLATFSGRTKNAVVLLKKGANFRVWDKNGQAPIHVAALKTKSEIVRALIEENIEIIEVRNKNMDTILNLSAQMGHIALVKQLVEKGADVNTKNIEGISPLLHFVQTGNLVGVKYLVEHNADINVVDNAGKNILYIALEGNHVNIIQYIIGERKFDWNKMDDSRKGACMDLKCKEEECPTHCPKKYFAFCDAIEYGKLDVLKYFIGTLNESECDPLHFAARHGQLEIMKYLIEERNLKVDGDKDEPHNTPLCFAVKENHLNIVEYLIGRNANINALCQHEHAPIDFAIDYGHLDIVRFLTENGVDLKHKNRIGYTPFRMAFILNQYEILKYFLEEQTQNIDKNERDEYGRTVLHWASKFGQLDLVQLFVEKGIDTQIRDMNGETALDLSGNKFIRDYLLSKTYRLIRKIPFPNKVHNRDIVFELGNRNVKYNDLKHINEENTEVTYNARNVAFTNVDVINTLLLLDVMIRYFTNGKYVSKGETTSDAEAQENAQTFTQRFEKLSSIKNLSEEQVNFTEMHKNMYKAIMSNTGHKIHQILCMSVKAFLSLNLNNIEQLMAEIINTTSIPIRSVSYNGVQFLKSSFQLLNYYCFHKVFKLNRMIEKKRKITEEI